MTVPNRECSVHGVVDNMMENGAHDVLVLRRDYGQELNPIVGQFIDDVNRESKTIIADWGLDY